MKVFISWSGERSREVALVLQEWIKCVLQIVKPWMSARNIDGGTVWFNQICTSLSESNVGIICLTNENKLKPWILFEAGALIKELSTSRVYTFLIDLQPSDIQDPLSQFNHTFPTREGLFKLIASLNIQLGESRLDPSTLERVFDTYWPQFEASFTRVISATNVDTPESPAPSGEMMTAEILRLTRSLVNRVSDLEQKGSSLYPSDRDFEHVFPKSAVFESELLGFGDAKERIEAFARAGLSSFMVKSWLNQQPHLSESAKKTLISAFKEAAANESLRKKNS